MEKILDPILSALAAAIALFLATIIKTLGDQLIQLIKVKVEATDQKLKASNLMKHMKQVKRYSLL